ncbi:hypothetical protein POTOM_056189 [Populus tomentosa]|uniref:Fe2OG dioxygenase domain-containing protein n=1 Tax=Populus tomentosa TaxID=118781 RepID=A0A8X8BY76_POPTO|nr:hypothetical protein POTOM_056189 [Populus tomentosa]
MSKQDDTPASTTISFLNCIDLSTPDVQESVSLLKQACLDCGFFYVTNHGISQEFMEEVFSQRDYKEGYYIGVEVPEDDPEADKPFYGPNVWPADGILPGWRQTMEKFHQQALGVARAVARIIALALDLEADFFDKPEMLGHPIAVMRLLHYAGQISDPSKGLYGAGAHSDYGLITLLATDDIYGLQICKDKDAQPQVWEFVAPLKGSTLHRVLGNGQERYSIAYFVEPSHECLVECLPTCKFPPIKCEAYLSQRYKDTHADLKVVHGQEKTLSFRFPFDGLSSVVQVFTSFHATSASKFLYCLQSNACLSNYPKLVTSPSPSKTLAPKACLDCGFFYVINHGISEELMEEVFEQNKKFFELPLSEKMKVLRNEKHRGYTPLFDELLDPDNQVHGDYKEGYYIGVEVPEDDPKAEKPFYGPNVWPSDDILPGWRHTMEKYYLEALEVARAIVRIIALALDLEADFFDKPEILGQPLALLRLLKYPGQISDPSNGVYGAGAHTDYGLITLLSTDDVYGLQICKDKYAQPRVWEFIAPLKGAFIVNLGDMLERWSNCLFKSTLHRVLGNGQERYSIAYFVEPSFDCLVECLPTCKSEKNPPKFPPVIYGDYLGQRYKDTHIDLNVYNKLQS